MTSCKSTGRCPDGPDGRSTRGRPARSRALGPPPLGHLVLNPRVLFRRGLANAPPVLVVPDLDQVVDADDPGDARYPGVLPLIRAQHDSPLSVELAFPRGAEHHAGQAAFLGRSGRTKAQALFPPPLLGWVQLKAAFGAFGNHGSGWKLFAKASRDGDASLGIHRMSVRTQKHQTRPPIVSLSPLFPTSCHRHAER